MWKKENLAQEWKWIIVPIHKKGDKMVYSNYTGITFCLLHVNISQSFSKSLLSSVQALDEIRNIDKENSNFGHQNTALIKNLRLLNNFKETFNRNF